jgi:hypothetical protein
MLLQRFFNAGFVPVPRMVIPFGNQKAGCHHRDIINVNKTGMI